MVKHAEPKTIFKMHRHPFGLISIWAATLIATLASFGLIAWMSASNFDLTAEQKTLGLLIMAVLTLIIVAMLFMMTSIYWASTLTLTGEDVEQTIQYGLFSSKKSRLSLANVEDVTAYKRGFVSSIVNYGTLNIETAGEQVNFKFKYCPDPNACAKTIMDARQDYIEAKNVNMASLQR